MRLRRQLLALVLTSFATSVLVVAVSNAVSQERLAGNALPAAERPFGTLREQAAMQQSWLKERLDTFLPPLMRNHGIDLWVVPMREYNEDPVFTSIVAPETFAARRRTIYVFFDKCAAANSAVNTSCIERLALGGTSQGGVFEARTIHGAVTAAPPSVAVRPSSGATSSGRLLKTVIEERKPPVIGIDRSTVFAFTDGLSSGELDGMSPRSARAWSAKFKDAERLPLELIASRLPAEEAFFEKMNALVWQMTQTMFSEKVSFQDRRAPATSSGGGASVSTIRASALGSSRASTCSGKAPRAARRRSGHPAGRCAALRRRHHGRAPEH